ncbi:hypothetical protein AM1_5184 [Acaryochloris marina MBIC11017]|uniref:Uncharacterized protein n=1 Tax=Acaryochloris marina (strain MBIC 11017) TaxID=329726 RepID=B0C8J1_ACAM1|nr:hypothetical protein AM1_5184 [Acaryochloris marina MBIC11017]
MLRHPRDVVNGDAYLLSQELVLVLGCDRKVASKESIWLL